VTHNNAKKKWNPDEKQVPVTAKLLHLLCVSLAKLILLLLSDEVAIADTESVE
jgi:hypothetical protein